MVSDGDSKAFTKVKESEVYGPDCEIEKLDCIGHVQKRMGKRLMNLKATHKEKLADGKTIGCRGRLSDSVIKKIQRYYGFAIRQNVLKGENVTEKQKEISIYQMKKNIIGILHHMINNKDFAQQHLYCPWGSESWCAWQRDVADGTKTFKNVNCLRSVFFDLLNPIFLDLSDEKLLARCVQRATQNPNESINSLVLVRCPKHKFNGAGPVKFAAASAVLAFNGGAERQVQLQSSLGTPISGSLVKTFLKRDKRRVKKSQKAADTKQKKKKSSDETATS